MKREYFAVRIVVGVVASFCVMPIVYGEPYDVSEEGVITVDLPKGLLVGGKAVVVSDVRVGGDVVVGAGMREVDGVRVEPSGGELVVRGGVLSVEGSVYVGDSGVGSFSDYVMTSDGQGGKLTVCSEGEVKVGGGLYMGYSEGSYDSEVRVSGQLSVCGSIFVGYFCSDDEKSCGAKVGDPQSLLRLGDGAEVTAEDLVVGNSGMLSVQKGAELTINGQLYVPSDEKDAMLVIAEGAVVSAQRMQIGSLSGSEQSGTVTAQIDGRVNLLSTGDSLRIVSGDVTIGENAVVTARGDVMIGSGLVENAAAGGTSDVSFVLNGQMDVINGATLYVKEDAGTVFIRGRTTAAKVDLEGSITVEDGGAFKVSGTTTVRGDLVLSNKNGSSSAGEGAFSLGDVYISEGRLRLSGGDIYAESVSFQTGMAKSLEIESDAALFVAGGMHAVKDVQTVVIDGKLSVSGVSDLGKVILSGSGEFEINGETRIVRLEAEGDETGDVGLEINNKLTVIQTYIGTDLTLSDTLTAQGEGSLGEMLIGSGKTLTLGGNVRADAVVTSDSKSKITVCGEKNDIGAVMIYGRDLAEISGIGTQSKQYLNEGETRLSGSLIVYDEESGTGLYENEGVTVLVINEKTAALGDEGSMLTVKSMEGEGSMRAEMDLSERSVQKLLGQQINFVSVNGKDEQLSQEQIENIVSGTARKASFVRTIESGNHEGNSNNYILIDYTDKEGKAKAFGYHYYAAAGDVSGESANVVAGGYTAGRIEYDRFSSLVHSRQDGQGDILAAERVYETEWSGNNIVTRAEKNNGTEEERIRIAADITAEGSLEGQAATPVLSVLSFYERTNRADGTAELTYLGSADQYKMTFRDDASYAGGEDGSGIFGFAVTEKQDEQGDRERIQAVDSVTISEGVKITLENLEMNANQSLSMGEGSELTIKDATVNIGGGKVTETEGLEDVAGDPLGELEVRTSEGEYKTLREIYSTTRSEIDHAIIRLVAENKDAVLLFREVTDANEAPIIQTTEIKNTEITLRQTNGKAILGSEGEGAAKIVLRGNTAVFGTGTLNNVTFENTILRYTMNSTMDGVNEELTFGCGTTGSVRLEWADTTTNMPKGAYYTEGATERRISLDQYTAAGLQVDASAMTNTLNQTALAYGYMWRYAEDALVLGYDIQADAQRIANTTVSSAATVAHFGRNARNQARNRAKKEWQNPTGREGINLWAEGMCDTVKYDTAKTRRGFEYKSGGYAVGCDAAIGSGEKKTVLGIAIGQTIGENTPKGGNGYYTAGEIDQDTLMCGVYGAHGFTVHKNTPLILDICVAYGKTECDSNRHSVSTGKTVDGEWKENTFGIGTTLTYVRTLGENTTVTPYIGAEYATCTPDSFVEHGYRDVSYEGSAYRNVSLSLGAELSKTYTYANGERFTPYIRMAYIGEVMRKDAKVTARSNGSIEETKNSVPYGRNALSVNIGATVQINTHLSLGIDYSAEIRNDATSQALSTGINYAF